MKISIEVVYTNRTLHNVLLYAYRICYLNDINIVDIKIFSFLCCRYVQSKSLRFFNYSVCHFSLVTLMISLCFLTLNILKSLDLEKLMLMYKLRWHLVSNVTNKYMQLSLKFYANIFFQCAFVPIWRIWICPWFVAFLLSWWHSDTMTLYYSLPSGRQRPYLSFTKFLAISSCSFSRSIFCISSSYKVNIKLTHLSKLHVYLDWCTPIVYRL